MKLHTSTYPLPGSDDRLVKVMVDRAVTLYGGLWIEFRIAQPMDVTVWDRHGDSSILPMDLRNQMRTAAMKAHTTYRRSL
jgi:hypothetical protein